MSGLAVAEKWAAELAAHNIRAGVDPRNVQPPGVLFVPGDVTFDIFGDARASTVEVVAFVLAPPPGNADSWRVLDRLLVDVAEILPVTSASAQSYELDSAGPSIPAYRLSWEESL